MNHDVVQWLLDSDPAIRWQVMRDLLNSPPDQQTAVRAKIETQGWGGQLFQLQDTNGLWAGGAFIPAGFNEKIWRLEGQPWTATCWVLTQLREFGLAPACDSAQRTVRLVNDHARWEHARERFWEGEVEECINGRTVADGAYFGVDVSPIVHNLLDVQQPDGGWNCNRANGSRVSSFDSTINVLEGLLEYAQQRGSTPQLQTARHAGEEYLLHRKLFRRLTTGEVADLQYLKLTYPNRWRHDVLRGLDYFRRASMFDQTPPDQRLAEAIQWVRDRQQPDGRWLMDWELRGRRWFPMAPGPGQPSRWITLKALRVLKWWDTAM